MLTCIYDCMRMGERLRLRTSLPKSFCYVLYERLKREGMLLQEIKDFPHNTYVLKTDEVNVVMKGVFCVEDVVKKIKEELSCRVK